MRFQHLLVASVLAISPCLAQSSLVQRDEVEIGKVPANTAKWRQWCANGSSAKYVCFHLTRDEDSSIFATDSKKADSVIFTSGYHNFGIKCPEYSAKGDGFVQVTLGQLGTVTVWRPSATKKHCEWYHTGAEVGPPVGVSQKVKNGDKIAFP
ncbi:hypothetical protein BCV70DRAFT_216771 [Testicularia cyperi]|uniref:Uncharacterized protein n=1 Tax=Testicularia cyperi TaxID=1882483 RepID=A0A317XRT1_9BASI|nr:hypothetical protein BCV70DRAFT_216771 [Testicularia cyperi]